ncbi:unnamed protein product [Phytophthora fragariaefolia]|uniref:Unnamed protein product n=1 Tax=Phytophthora fragariaefolia TaxID=1490495 RepID=A0A9W6WZ04_9STRA|nr:unnamed protein product [Phytophthora fragariaefolia]
MVDRILTRQPLQGKNQAPQALKPAPVCPRSPPDPRRRQPRGLPSQPQPPSPSRSKEAAVKSLQIPNYALDGAADTIGTGNPIQEPQNLEKIAKKTSDTKKIRATWEATVNVFLERALIEGAWGDSEEGRDVSVSQIKNKLNAIQKAYRAKRARMLGTGNRALDTSSSGEGDTDEGSRGGRSHPELPSNYLLDNDEAVDDAGRIQLTCEPVECPPGISQKARKWASCVIHRYPPDDCVEQQRHRSYGHSRYVSADR